jgi:hypothetical protein
MLALFPREAISISIVCFIVGVAGGLLTDKIAKRVNLQPDEACEIELHTRETNLQHFLKEHVYNHILKKHAPRLFLWIFSALLAVHLMLENFDIALLISSFSEFWLLILAALIGIIPESGPHLIFLFLYAEGLIPLSVLLVNTLSQDGHGLLPLIAHSVKDTVYVQIFTTLISLAIGVLLYSLGL